MTPSATSNSTAASLSTADSDRFTTASLQKLQSTDERKLLDVVDKLRRTGLNGTIELPQLVVCSDQSSGKSSVLEAIIEIPFPRKAGLCTRFATEIVLRRQPTSEVTVKINPHKLRTKEEQKKLAHFKKTITDIAQLPDIIEAATTEMGLGRVGESTAFSRDVLIVEICGPDRPQLTLVDLPGLIHSATKASSEADKDLIFDLVQEYMKSPRTIILAVVSAKNDAANQVILSLFKKIDDQGSRTLGIITKPDCMSAGDEQFWFDLAANKEIRLQRGWHMIKNRAETEVGHTLALRNEAEKSFFNKGRFKDLPRSSVGVETLRSRLSTLLHRHLVQELPTLQIEMNDKLKTTKEELNKLGERRDTLQQQRIALTEVGSSIYQIITAANGGHYANSFFNPASTEDRFVGGPKIRRFRAVIQDLNQTFAENMRRRGHKYHFQEKKVAVAAAPAAVKPQGLFAFGNGTLPPKPPAAQSNDLPGIAQYNGEASTDENMDDWLPKPKIVSHGDAIKWVKTMIRGCRGHELPGSVNPEVVSHLFWEQSEPWKDIFEDRIENVRAACQRFIQEVVQYAAPAEFQKPLEDQVVNAVLAATLKDAQDELRKLLQDKSRPPTSYNHYFTDTVQKHRHEKYKVLAAEAQKSATQDMFSASGPTLNLDTFQREMEKAVERNMESFTAEEALHCQRAIYKEKMKYYITAVTDQVIERCMVDPLPKQILGPTAVAAMTDDEVAYIAAEPPETVAERDFLEERKQMLENGLRLFKQAMKGPKRTSSQAFGS